MSGHADVLLTLITDQSFSGFSEIDFLSTVLNGVQTVTGSPSQLHKLLYVSNYFILRIIWS